MTAVSTLTWTVDDLAQLPDKGCRYEIIQGELFVSRSPHFRHQNAADNICTALKNWSRETERGYVFSGVGVFFDLDEAVIPDVVWIRRESLDTIMDTAGHLTAAPDLAIEVISPGDGARDQKTKLELYSRRGVQEYWILDRIAQEIEVYRRGNDGLQYVAVVTGGEILTSPMLPGFECVGRSIFEL